MRDVIVLLLVWTLISCGEKQDKVVVKPIQTDEIDVTTELAKIEQVRRSFEQTVKEKR